MGWRSEANEARLQLAVEKQKAERGRKDRGRQKRGVANMTICRRGWKKCLQVIYGEEELRGYLKCYGRIQASV